MKLVQLFEINGTSEGGNTNYIQYSFQNRSDECWALDWWRSSSNQSSGGTLAMSKSLVHHFNV